MKNQNNETNNTTPFENLKRQLECEYTSGKDYVDTITELATAIAKSTLNKCLDPQRKTAGRQSKVSNNGNSPVLIALKMDINNDRRKLARAKRTDDNKRYTLNFDKDGNFVSQAKNSDDYIINDTISDGYDLVQTAIMAILEQYAKHYNGQDNFLDWQYTVSKLSKKVYIQADDSKCYKDVPTTPTQEVYRVVREQIENNRAIQADPKNGYVYIEELTESDLEPTYRRLQKHFDLGGENADGIYTADTQSLTDYNDIMAKLQLTKKQADIVNLRMRGYGYKAIASYLGVTHNAIINTLKKIQKKWEASGLALPQK